MILSSVELFVYYGAIALAVKSSFGGRYAIIKFHKTPRFVLSAHNRINFLPLFAKTTIDTITY